jgi:hypothetical protein
LIAGALGSGINVDDLFEFVLSARDRCSANPFNIFDALEAALTKFLPENAGRSMSGRVRTLLTRVSWKVPFVTGEIVDQYRDRSDCFHTMRASCHIPGIFLKPYSLDGRGYFDGMLWPSFFVPWASDDSHTIRISAISRPLTDISAPLHPFWWLLFPPSVDVLRGMMYTGYRDAARWFLSPPMDPLDLCRCRKPQHKDAIYTGGSTDMVSQSSGMQHRRLKREAAQKLVRCRKQLSREEMPILDAATGRKVEELMQIYNRSVERNLTIACMVAATAFVIAAFWS